GLVVVKELEERVDVTPFSLKVLQHRREDDFALVNRGEIERAFFCAENLRDFGREKVLQVVADGFADAAMLFFGLVEKAVREMGIHSGTARCFEESLKILHFFFEAFAVGQQLKSGKQRHGAAQLKEEFERV